MSEPTEMLVERMDRLRKLIRGDYPDFIKAHCAASIVDSLSLLWPDLWTQFGRDLQKTLRNQSGRCAQCGETEIPAILCHHVDCRSCSEEFVAELDGIGIDVHEPNPPEIEELLIDATLASAAKVNNLDDDFCDALSRMLEAKATP